MPPERPVGGPVAEPRLPLVQAQAPRPRPPPRRLPARLPAPTRAPRRSEDPPPAHSAAGVTNAPARSHRPLPGLIQPRGPKGPSWGRAPPPGRRPGGRPGVPCPEGPAAGRSAAPTQRDKAVKAGGSSGTWALSAPSQLRRRILERGLAWSAPIRASSLQFGRACAASCPRNRQPVGSGPPHTRPPSSLPPASCLLVLPPREVLYFSDDPGTASSLRPPGQEAGPWGHGRGHWADGEPTPALAEESRAPERACGWSRPLSQEARARKGC
ncbi:uncharacterized protein LOC110260401 [Sus scrofa]|uniref:uncharacterized protein LOC110260401 n=1 Tax=Sus scrofa TaxID=9823 RepID=UPI000A2B5360|nr:uncharacterized protein LOC110260401 [Sus scrofa]